MDALHNSLRKYFGFSSFRLNQEAIIRSVLHKQDVVALMPTGGGKSVCYQLPALLLPGLTVVISPLIALMKDQVDALRLNGIEAAFLNSTQTTEEQEEVLRRAENGTLKLLYMAPERLSSGGNTFFSTLRNFNIALFAIDEAHCISHWGHDFRPDYLTLSRLKEQFPGVPLIALTATADNLTRTDIVNKLQLHAPELFVSSFNRANIRYVVEKKKEYFEKLIDYLQDHRSDAGIIYCLSRKNTEDLAEKLKAEGFKAEAYHAGLDNATRKLRQEQFKRDEISIVVATIAFGMGIDKPNVRFVVHVNLPKNIESYYQETGRAGRDGLPAEAILYYSAGDVITLRNFATVEGNAEQTRIMLRKLDRMSDFCQSRKCRREILLNYFDEAYKGPCGNCDRCLDTKVADVFDGTIIAQKVLSAVTRLREHFGAGYVIDFLKGSGSAKIREEHRYLPTFGKGNEFTAEQWRAFIKDLLDQGYLKQSNNAFAVLQLTPAAKRVLYEGEKVELHTLVSKKEEREQRKHRASPSLMKQDYEKKLMEELRALRMEIATDENVPPYIVFPDSTLVELATYLPLKPEHLPAISGFGQVKIMKYGKSFLDAVKDYCFRHNLETRMQDKAPSKPKAKPRTEKTTDTKLASLELYRQGYSIEEIAEKRNLAASTIGIHLTHFIMTGEINVLKFVSKEKIPVIAQAISEKGETELGMIKNSLGENYSFMEIRAVINYMKRKVDRG